MHSLPPHTHTQTIWLSLNYHWPSSMIPFKPIPIPILIFARVPSHSHHEGPKWCWSVARHMPNILVWPRPKENYIWLFRPFTGDHLNFLLLNPEAMGFCTVIRLFRGGPYARGGRYVLSVDKWAKAFTIWMQSAGCNFVHCYMHFEDGNEMLVIGLIREAYWNGVPHYRIAYVWMYGAYGGVGRGGRFQTLGNHWEWKLIIYSRYIHGWVRPILCIYCQNDWEIRLN